jgi:hypothetical protein
MYMYGAPEFPADPAVALDEGPETAQGEQGASLTPLE